MDSKPQLIAMMDKCLDKLLAPATSLAVRLVALIIMPLLAIMVLLGPVFENPDLLKFVASTSVALFTAISLSTVVGLLLCGALLALFFIRLGYSRRRPRSRRP